jgi:hypothetical protein
MFLDAPIDPNVPTDPQELALYRKYGKNWRTVLSGTNRRDRGGNLDRGMRFFHTTPEGFLTKPKAMSQTEMIRSDINSAELFADLERERARYNAYLKELYDLQNTPAYNRQQDYYYNNYLDLYGNSGDNTSQTNQYIEPVAPPAPIQLMPPAPALQKSPELTRPVTSPPQGIGKVYDQNSRPVAIANPAKPKPPTKTYKPIKAI